MTNRTPRCSHRDLHNDRVSRQVLEQQLRVANERILEMEADARRQQEAETVRNNERQREHEEHVRRMANDYWRRVAAIQLLALNRENQLNARIAELEQALVAQRPVEDAVPDDPNPENGIELPVVEEVVNEDFEGARHNDDDADNNLPEIPFEAAVARVGNEEN